MRSHVAREAALPTLTGSVEMKILITGATGFIGRSLTEGLLADGHRVVATGRNDPVGRKLEASGASFHPADIRDHEILGSLLPDVEAVIHCAGKSGDRGAEDEFHSVNVGGTKKVLSACLQSRVSRLIFMSTPSIYYTGRDRLGVCEDDPLPSKQKSMYGCTKVAAEKAVVAAQKRGLQSIILRPRGVYGPHDNTILPRILRLAQGKRFPLVDGGRALTDITYIENLVDAVRLALRAKPDAWNHAYNITNGEPIAVRDWFKGVLQELDREFLPRTIPRSVAMALGMTAELASRLPLGPKSPPITRFSAGYMGTSMTLSTRKAKGLLGYSPAIGNVEGFRRTGRWWSQKSAGEVPRHD